MADVETQPTTEGVAMSRRNHAVWILPLNMGSCNGCDQQILGMLAPRYQLARQGIKFASSPRHADIILLTGTPTTRSLEAVQQVLEQVPDPHALIAVGDCAINGGIFAGSDQVIPNATELLGVNIEITGNPPAPSEIILAITKATELLDDPTGGLADVDDEGDSDDDAEEVEQ